ncbi:glycoside hydrolase family 2 protein [Bacteroides sp. 51]|uniref:glycoside hydrolase family 2 protein n=1 Tax=Bacteroides sp. 51 TaxID=2302938 RepID=UPI00351B1418
MPDEAPEPASGRITIPFNDNWLFKKGPFEHDPVLAAATPFLSDQSILGGFGDPAWETVTIPHTWNATDMQTEKNSFYAGEAYYRKSYTPALTHKDKRIFLRFEGVASTAHVYINGQFAGKHEGGYPAFAVEISSLLNVGKPNEILVKVNNASRPDVIPVNHNLFGVYGGMYRPVSLIITEKVHIAVTDHASPGLYISQKEVSRKSATINIRTKLENKYNHPLPMRLVTTIYESDGRIKDKQQTNIILSPQGRQTAEQQFTLRHPHLWQGLEDPYLYRVVTQLVDHQDRITDEVTQPLGVRHIRFKKGDGLYLNEQKVPMYGVCRHQDRWQVGSALTHAHHDEDLALIREMGATTIRLAHYQQAEYVYAKCDSIGFLVWAEIPFVNRVTTHEADNARRQLTELIRQNYNHPSIYVWGLHNEVYIPHNYTAEITAELHDLAKSEDPGRYTVAVNGYGDAGHPVNMQADIQGINRYFGWYERKTQDLKPWLESLERDYPHHLIILAEYGAEANIDQQDEQTGEVGDCCGFTNSYNETFATRLHEKHWGYIAHSPHLAASYIWNMFDFCTPMAAQGGVEARNMKGLVTFDRKTKKDPFYWYKANWSKEPVLYITGRRNTERYQAVTTVNVYSNLGQPVLFVNGQEIKSAQKGTTPVHYIFENVNLAVGKNTLEVKAKYNGITYQDQIIWFYHPENKAGNQTLTEREKEHSGL